MAEAIRVLGIVGSRRRNGNTSVLVDAVLEGARSRGAEAEMIRLSDYDLLACTACESCAGTFTCVLNDRFHEITGLIDRSDCLVIGSPTYWYSVTSDVKRFIDRSYALIDFPSGDRRRWVSAWSDASKYAVPLAVCEQPDPAMMGDTLELLQKWARDLAFEVISPIAAVGFFEAGSVRNDRALLERARTAGTAIVERITRASS